MLYHMQDLMMLSEGQIQDLLYLYHLENARVAQLKAQREAAVNKLMGNSHSADAILKQHPSDSITVSNDVADQLRKIGLAQYKLRGIVYDAFFHGVWLPLHKFGVFLALNVKLQLILDVTSVTPYLSGCMPCIYDVAVMIATIVLMCLSST